MSANIREIWVLPDSALKPALALALAIERAPMGILLLRNHGSGALEPVLAEGLTEEAFLRFGALSAGIGPVCMAYAEHRRVSIKDCTRDGAVEASLREIAVGIGFRGLDVLPLVVTDGNVIGALAALFPRARHASKRAAALAEDCARLMALALDNARLRMDAERRREIVEELSRARMEFVARMSHELRTPLQSITGYIDLLALGNPDPLTERQQQLLEHVRVSENILIRVIDDLTAMAKLEAGRLEYLITPVRARAAISTAAVVIQPLAEQKHVLLDIAKDGPDVITQADDTKLKQVLINLMANAVKFTPPGGTVRVSSHAEDSTVVFEVADTGEGIPMDRIESAFEPYVQLGDESSRIAGSGLGLAISREFAHGMRGSLSATSSPGKGSVFTVRLPRAAASENGVVPSPNGPGALRSESL